MMQNQFAGSIDGLYYFLLLWILQDSQESIGERNISL